MSDEREYALIAEAMQVEAESHRKDAAVLRVCAVAGAAIAAFEIGLAVQPDTLTLSIAEAICVKAAIIASLVFSLATFIASMWASVDASNFSTIASKTLLGDQTLFSDRSSALKWLIDDSSRRQKVPAFAVLIRIAFWSFLASIGSVIVLVFVV